MLVHAGWVKSAVYNVTIILVWNFTVFFICRTQKDSFFSAKKKTYKEKPFEKCGKFYVNVLKINVWKDYLPQYAAKNGFSKKKFESKDKNYINRFILETCRAEWNHKMCTIVALPVLIFNKADVGIVFTAIVFLTNLPYIIIQRYNRFRLLRIKNRVVNTNIDET